MEKIVSTDTVRNEEVLHRVKQERNILYAIKIMKVIFIGHLVCMNYILKHIIGGKIEGGRESVFFRNVCST
jgi:hypothetical protein